MMNTVRLSHLADNDLDDIRDYIQQDNPRAANEVLDKIFEALELLANYPEIGERHEELGRNIRAFTVRPYVIFYHPAADGIHVARIVHGARDFPTLFQS
jgi:toxin ParE1/3/4